jgi:hypothetical protein
MEDAAVFLFMSVAVTASFSFIAVLVWTTARRKEREAFYRSETLKKLAESSVDSALQFLRETERIAARRTQAGLRLGGLLAVAGGAGAMIFLYAIEKNEPMYLAACVPLCVGVALLIYAQFLAPTE